MEFIRYELRIFDCQIYVNMIIYKKKRTVYSLQKYQ